MFTRPLLRTMTLLAGTWLAASIPLAGCAPSGTRPDDMSAVEHEAAAAGEEEIADEHLRRADEPSARAGGCEDGAVGPCWTPETRRAEREEAERHRELARRHREASADLRAAEARSCSRLTPDDRDESPLSHREDIRGVEPLMVFVPAIAPDDPGTEALGGATVTLRAVRGLTVEWLRAAVECHLARNSVTGGAGMESCPLAVPGVQATVRTTGDGFTVAIRADDEASAREVLRRAQALVGAEGPTD